MSNENHAKRPTGKIASVVSALAEEVADRLEMVIWDVEYLKEGGRYVLRITIDKEEGVDINDCEAFHRAIDPVLDEADPIADPYVLEVSSPGIERELKNDFHLSACEGWNVEVKLYAPLNGAKLYRGELLPCEENEISIRLPSKDGEGEILHFPRTSVAKVQTYFDFGDMA